MHLFKARGLAARKTNRAAHSQSDVRDDHRGYLMLKRWVRLLDGFLVEMSEFAWAAGADGFRSGCRCQVCSTVRGRGAFATLPAAAVELRIISSCGNNVAAFCTAWRSSCMMEINVATADRVMARIG